MIKASQKLTFHLFGTGVSLLFISSHNHSICRPILSFIYFPPNSMERALSYSIQSSDQSSHDDHNVISYAVFRASTFPKKYSLVHHSY
jgi:hypothetical protein